MCIICTGEIYKQNLNTLTELNVSFCSNLTSEKLQEILIQCKNLVTLDCFNCTSLTSLNLRSNINLIILYCYSCISLTSLDLRSNIKLTRLWCNNCTSLTSLDLRNNINLTELWCYDCTFLTSLNLQNDKYYQYIQYCRCPWISQYKDFSNNLQRLIRIQKWYRRILLIKYMKSKQFVEWIYAPNNIGGKCHKLKLLKEFS